MEITNASLEVECNNSYKALIYENYMADVKNLVFFRIEDSRIEAMVKGLGDEVTFEEADKIDEVAASEFDLGYMPSCLCQEGSAKADELSVDSRYVSKYLRF